ncbi:MAG: macro domain-containing protein [Anaerolineae bacterium]|nr:macro domain-containing protein [Anaerolineae bacterium]
MILYVKGNLFQSPAQVLVNTVNTVGVMGCGIALDFKKLFPDMYKQYRDMCETGEFKVGMLWLYKSPNKWVLNFPTKQHWCQPSRVEYIEIGLRKFVASYSDLGIHSIAFPALGCGNGQLDFRDQVQPLMKKYLETLPIDIFIYPGRTSQFVEHLNPEKMKEWLRTEPTTLPFSEVWDDLLSLLRTKSEFKTLSKQRPFEAQICEDALELRIVTGSQNYVIHYETLMAFWQQLRTYGFSMRHIAPGIDRQVSYLIPIFAELDYIAPVHVTENFDKLTNSVITGLQVLPSAFDRKPEALNPSVQMSLFQL